MSQYPQFCVEYNYVSVPMKIKVDTEVHKVIESFNEFEYNLTEISASGTQEIIGILW